VCSVFDVLRIECWFCQGGNEERANRAIVPPEIIETIFMFAFVLGYIGQINQPINVPCFLKLTTHKPETSFETLDVK